MLGLSRFLQVLEQFAGRADRGLERLRRYLVFTIVQLLWADWTLPRP